MSRRPRSYRTWLRPMAAFTLPIAMTPNRFYTSSAIVLAQTVESPAHPCRRQMPKGHSSPSIPAFLYSNWSRLCKAANLSTIPTRPLRYQCSLPPAIGPWPAARISTKSAWKDLVGASLASPAAFVQKLLATDKGWLTAYFDVLSRVRRDQQAYFIEPHRLRLFYEALRSSDPSVSATRGIFRPAPALLLLATRLQWEPNGEPLVPGNLDVWRDILHQKKRSPRPATPDQLIQTMFALSRMTNDDGPLQIYLAIAELDSRRPPEQRLQPATVRLLAHRFPEFSDQYRIFSEFQELNDASIVLFLDTAEALNNVPNPVRGNALGTFQANVGMWQILARQGQ